MRNTAALVAILAVGAVSGCASNVEPTRAPCTSDGGCLPGESCLAGACTAGVGGPCVTDFDCDPSAGEICINGTCGFPAIVASGGPCTTTAECPDTDFCNNATGNCEPMLEGWCRLPEHCAAPTPLCDTDTAARPGLCVACIDSSDCSGGATCSDGACTNDGPAGPSDCPANASLVPGSTTVCQCDAGFTPDAATSTCRETGSGGAPPDEITCVANASPVPGVPGQCRCNAGFAPNEDGTACVPSGDQPPPSDGGGGGVGGGGGGGTGGGGGGGDEPDCGPNAVNLFFTCVCLPGFVKDDLGPGCVLDEAALPTDDGCPINSSPDPADDTSCICDDGFEANAAGTGCQPIDFSSGGDGCPANASPDPSDDNFCICDPGFVVSGTQCVANTDDGCGANSSPDPTDDRFCICDDGYVVNAAGTGCELDTSPQDACPANSSPDPADDAFCICDPGFVVSGGACVASATAADNCPANSSPDPNDPDFCNCDPGFVVNDAGTACVEDICATNGFYGDGLCDDFCPFADPDC